MKEGKGREERLSLATPLDALSDLERSWQHQAIRCRSAERQCGCQWPNRERSIVLSLCRPQWTVQTAQTTPTHTASAHRQTGTH